MLVFVARLLTSLFVRATPSALTLNVPGAAGAVVVREYPGRGRGRGGVEAAPERVASMEPLEPKGLCLREGDLVILDRKPAVPPPDELFVEPKEPSR